MKLIVLAAVMGSMLMEEAEASASAGGGALADAKVEDQAPVDVDGVPPSPQLDRNTAAAAGGDETPDPVVDVVTAGVDSADEYALACADGNPKVALVGKYQDQVPVQLRDKHHLAKLVAEHGEGNVTVQS
jgi:hypothetical protein